MDKISTTTGYRKLVIYRKSKELVLYVYKLTSGFPKTEIYTLVPQIRRSSISVLANIVEGYSRESSAEYARFLTISIASLAEVEVLLEISYELKYISDANYRKVSNLILENKKLLYQTRKTIRARRKANLTL